MGIKKDLYLDDYKGMNIEIEFKDIVDEYAQKTVKIVSLYSNKRKARRKNNYASTWAIKRTEHGKKIADKVYGAKVWNEKNYRLTHLLENGHLIVNKKGGVGWARGNNHIERAFRNVKQPFINAMARAKVDVDFK